MQINEKIKFLREQAHKTHAEISEVIQKSVSTYKAYEAGSIKPKLPVLIKLSKYYDISLDDLCNHKKPQEFGEANPKEREILKKVLALDSNQLRKLIIYLNKLINNQN